MYPDDKFDLAELEDKIIETVDTYVQYNVPRPFGLLLSGGFDSGLLAAITKPDFIFTVRFSQKGAYDESRYADAIIDHLHLQSKTTVIEITKEYFIKNASAAIKAMSEPISHFSLVPFYILMQFVAERMKGIGIVPHILSGEGIDEYLGGYARQIIIDELNKLYKIPELRGYHEMVTKVLGERLVTKYGEMMSYPVEKSHDYQAMYEDYQYPLQGAIGKMDMELGVIEKMEQKMAKNAGAHLHYPYINDEFAEYCYTLPDHLKIRNGVTKWAFRQICKKYLPEFMWDRSKQGGPVAPVNQWLFNKEGFDKKDWLEYQRKVLDEAK